MIRVSNIKVDVISNDIEKSLLKKLNIKKDDLISFDIVKKSIDARKEVCFIYELDVKLRNENKIIFNKDISKPINEKYEFNYINLSKNNKIVIVGSGPSGLFCAYEFVKKGYKVTIVERGEKVEDRIKSVNKFWNENILNEKSNIQFGEGGAGTFSDGKLTTGIKDKNNRIKEVLDTFISFGAPYEIKYLNHPHIGTDNLVSVIKNMREFIIKNGSKYLFNSTLTDINIEDNHIKNIVINDKDVIECDKLILALGHSARDTFRMLYSKGLNMQNKAFAVGVRVIHDQEMINKNQYGKYYKYLDSANYKLTYNTSDRSVYSFCMCPGGYVINASSKKNHLVVNGMSNFKRDSGKANSAIVFTINEKDYGSNLFDGVKYQERLESDAYNLCNGLIPVQRLIDFKNNKLSFEIDSNGIKGKYDYGNIRSLFNENINKLLIDSFEYFDTKIKGFNGDDTVLCAVESRTSSPIRIIRDENMESNIKGIYPIGEGAGYAGGITSAAVDGIKVFEQIVKNN